MCLLRDSMASHDAAAAQRRQGDKAGARAAIAIALRLREQAHALDPDHLAPAWAVEQGLTPRGTDTHDALTAFYRQQLSEAA